MNKRNHHRYPARMRQLGIAISMMVAAGVLAGCQQTASTEVALYDQDYKRRHPILVSEEPSVLDIPIGMKATRLSADVQRRMRSFVADYKRTGPGSVTIQVPSGSANEIAAPLAARPGRPFASLVVPLRGSASHPTRSTTTARLPRFGSRSSS